MDFLTCVNSRPLLLMEGALGERLKREFGLVTNGPAGMANLVYSNAGRDALRAIWLEYASIAQKYHLPFLATTPTRRTSLPRVTEAGLDERVIRDNLCFLASLRDECETEIYAGGMVGSTGNAYTGEGCLSMDAAMRLHRWEVQLFAAAGADFLYAALFPTLPEALAIAALAAETLLPYVLSFTIQGDGRLIDGTAIAEAIQIIDSSVSRPPVFYMTNCVHPKIVAKALEQDFNRTPMVRERFLGLQANTSALPYRELDASPVLYSSPPEELALEMLKLKEEFGFHLFGGCCGTDARHIEAMAALLTNAV